MDKILIVEDEENIAEMVKLFLSKRGFLCEIAGDGTAAAEAVERDLYQLVLLDVMLPGIDGFELIPYIRQYDIPVIFVTARVSVKDRIRGLKLGAEDYILKPFDLEELLARIEVVLRRRGLRKEMFDFGRVHVDAAAHRVFLEGKAVSLSAKEYDLLLYFAANRDIALSREKIYEHVWKEPYSGETRTIDLHVQRLKKKLELTDEIQTIYKLGYLFHSEKA